MSKPHQFEAGPFPGETKEQFFSPDKLSRQAWDTTATTYDGHKCPVQPGKDEIPVMTTDKVGTGCETVKYGPNWHPAKEGDLDIPALYKMAKDQSVEIKAEDLPIHSRSKNPEVGAGTGSGVIVGRKGDEILVMTDNHVLGPHAGRKTVSLEARFGDGQVYEGRVLVRDSQNDTAIVAFKTGANTQREFHPAKVQDQWTRFKPGQQYLTTGYPEYASLLHASPGQLLGLERSDKAQLGAQLPGEDRKRFRAFFAQHTSEGGSGGATYDRDGFLVGTLDGGIRHDITTSMINPISKQYVNRLLKKAGSDTTL